MKKETAVIIPAGSPLQLNTQYIHTGRFFKNRSVMTVAHKQPGNDCQLKRKKQMESNWCDKAANSLNRRGSGYKNNIQIREPDAESHLVVFTSDGLPNAAGLWLQHFKLNPKWILIQTSPETRLREFSSKPCWMNVWFILLQLLNFRLKINK